MGVGGGGERGLRLNMMTGYLLGLFHNSSLMLPTRSDVTADICTSAC